MSNISLLKKQHESILEVIKHLEELIENSDFEKSAKDIAYGINNLSGKIKMHLMSEDKYLYPELMNSKNSDIKNTARMFNDEMGSLAGAFADFVQAYNIPAKIIENKSAFVEESAKVFGLVIKRIDKEGGRLYPLLEAGQH